MRFARKTLSVIVLWPIITFSYIQQGYNYHIVFYKGSTIVRYLSVEGNKYYTVIYEGLTN